MRWQKSCVDISTRSTRLIACARCPRARTWCRSLFPRTQLTQPAALLTHLLCATQSGVQPPTIPSRPLAAYLGRSGPRQVRSYAYCFTVGNCHFVQPTSLYVHMGHIVVELTHSLPGSGAAAAKPQGGGSMCGEAARGAPQWVWHEEC